MPFIGLDVLAIRHLARQLDIQSAEVDQAANELTRLIESTDWFGADSRRFLEQWHATQVPQLKKSSALLKQASQLATRGATKQEDVSRGR
ncbi:MAG: hypothetical protein KJ659_11240 [Actinobacteria bacterium]|nr:hypothetical protein [Actinomycetota bacterium]MBU1607924.1 hypothetical protein [Actinomycetota bacterium]MBU2316100.1 hypothetical protein [Actinomycetota bacterium]MBU2386048.1 hypothetical protein [Actinomycetota bacterium]